VFVIPADVTQFKCSAPNAPLPNESLRFLLSPVENSWCRSAYLCSTYKWFTAKTEEGGLIRNIKASCLQDSVTLVSFDSTPDVAIPWKLIQFWFMSWLLLTLWPESATELYRPSDRRFSKKLMPTFADRGCYVVSVTDPYGRILGFLDRSCYFFVQVAPQLYSRGEVDPVPDPLLIRKSRSDGNQTWTSGSVVRNSDH
jgi:hypothetical protein